MCELEFRNNFTKRLDCFLNKDWKEVADKIYDGELTYLWKPDVERYIERGDSHIAFRTPGATRGHIEVDDTGFITKVRFYQPEADGVYEGDYEKVLADEFVGHRLDISEFKGESENE